MSPERLNRLLAGFVFLASFLVYFSTMAPTVSFWDCGEFIATSYRLGVPHPPGAPLFLILGRFFSLLPEHDFGYHQCLGNHAPLSDYCSVCPALARSYQKRGR